MAPIKNFLPTHCDAFYNVVLTFFYNSSLFSSNPGIIDRSNPVIHGTRLIFRGK